MEKIVKLDKKDKRLLFELELDCRQPLAELGKKIGLSKQVADYRLKRLVKEGVIERFLAIVDFSKLGFTQYKLYLRFQIVDLEKEAKIIRYWVESRNAMWVASCTGSWDLAVSFLAENPAEIGSVLDSFLAEFGRMVLEKDLLITLVSPMFTKQYLPEQKEKKEFVYGAKTGRYELDGIEKTLLGLLAANARWSVVELMRKTGFSRDVIAYRLKKLEKDGILVQYRAELDLERTGSRLYKILLRLYHFSPEKEKQLVVFVRQHANGRQFLKLLGNWDCELEFETENEEQLNEIIRELRRQFSGIIRDYSVLRIRKNHRFSFWPF